MHVIKSYPTAEQNKLKTFGGTGCSPSQRSFISGSGLHDAKSAHTSQPASQRYQGEREVPSSTRRFANNYAAFYNVPTLNDEQYNQGKAMRGQLKAQKLDLNNRSARLNTGVLEDPNFVANKARFYGAAPKEQDEFYKATRAFYASTPLVRHATHVGSHTQDQQKSIVRNRLQENAKRILNTKSFDDGKPVALRREYEKTQKEHLQQSGFATSQLAKVVEEPASYEKLQASGQLGFTYKKQPFESVCKPDPTIKNLGGARYNIVTGSIQPWFGKK